MALAGVHLNVIQMQLGPNPKAIIRYLKKYHKIDYMKFKAKLVKKGEKPKTLVQLAKQRHSEKVEKDYADRYPQHQGDKT